MNQNFDSNESFLSYKLNILKDLYKSECEQKKDASQRITRIIPLIVAMFGADAYVIINTGNSILRNKEFSISIQSIILYILCVITICSACILLIYLIKSCINFNEKTFNPDKFKLMFELGEEQLNSKEYKQIVNEIDQNIYRDLEEASIKLYYELKKREDYITKLYLALITNCLFACFTLIVIWI